MGAVADRPGAEAIASKGWLKAHQWMLLRRGSQLVVLFLFLSGAWLGVWIAKGNLASSLTLGVLPLTDPLVVLQEVLAGHVPLMSAFVGVAIVLLFYLILGGRVYCSWVCPVNIVTDAAEWLRVRLKIKGGAHLSRQARYWLLGAILLGAYLSGSILWELVNPVSMVFRGLIFGMGLAWGMVAAVFVFDLVVSRRGWCGHLCPVGAFYSLVGNLGVVRISAFHRDRCNDCMDCFAVCPEHQVIRPALKGAEKGLGPVILDGNCTNCGRCVDVCAQDVFSFSTRFNNVPKTTGIIEKSEVLP